MLNLNGMSWKLIKCPRVTKVASFPCLMFSNIFHFAIINVSSTPNICFMYLKCIFILIVFIYRSLFYQHAGAVCLVTTAKWTGIEGQPWQFCWGQLFVWEYKKLTQVLSLPQSGDQSWQTQWGWPLLTGRCTQLRHILFPMYIAGERPLS